MTDSQILKLLRRIDKLNGRISDIIAEIEASGHPNASLIIEQLAENHFDNPAWAEHCFEPKSKRWVLNERRRYIYAKAGEGDDDAR